MPRLLARSRRAVLGALAALLAALLVILVFYLRHRAPPALPGAPPVVEERFVQAGVAVELAIRPVDPQKSGAPFHEGDDVAIRFTITDAASRAPLSRVYPTGWMVPAQPGDADCVGKVKGLLGGGSFAPATTLDLNLYYVLVLNADATVSVVDPRFGFGGSKLLSMIFLQRPGADWALTADQSRLFISMPDADRVAVVDPGSFQVKTEIAAGPRPSRVALQPDGGYLWVASEGSTVTVIAVADLRIAARIDVGAGPHAIAFSEDSRTAFVTSRDAGEVAVVDVARLKIVETLATGPAPGAVAFSRTAKAAYVTDARDGSISAIGAEERRISARIKSDPGLGGIVFEPKGRFGFAWNPETDTVVIVDAASNREVQRGHVEKGPDQITFSDGLAYVRHRGSETVLMIPLDRAGGAGEALPVADFPGGQAPPGAAPLAPTIAQAVGEAAVLVVNPADKAIYYYREGMAAPMGHFDAYGHEPRSVIVLDRSLRERTPGVYETTARLRGHGREDLVFLLDAPRVVHCFGVDVAEDPTAVKPAQGALVEPLFPPAPVPAGEPVHLRLRLLDPVTRAPLVGVADASVLAYFAPGAWHDRQWARDEGDGVYGVDFRPPEPGSYGVMVEIRSLGLTANQRQHLSFSAVARSKP